MNTNPNRKANACFVYEKNKNSKSIFDYVTDVSLYKNEKQCVDFTPPFLGYVQAGIPQMNVDIENDLRGGDRLVSKCGTCKYIPNDPSVASEGLSKVKSEFYNANECTDDMKILPNGYYQKK
jgi:hypothetical protein